MKNNVLITGGTGTIGKELTKLLQKSGYQVSYLTRDTRQRAPKGVRLFAWNMKKQEIEPAAIREADYIIHLAGAGIADKRWTEDRKELIRKSRTQTAALLRKYLGEVENDVKAVISASGVTRYGMDTGDRWLFEDDPAGDDFVAKVVVDWEREIDRIAEMGYRTAKLRLGVVLSESGGALEKISTPIKLWVGAPLGEGRQYVPWIHIDDVCQAFLFALENESIQEAYHVTAPNPVTNAVLTEKIARVLGKPLFVPNVPAFAMKFVLGDLAKLVLGGNRISSEKLQKAGFSFRYTQIEPALKNLLT